MESLCSHAAAELAKRLCVVDLEVLLQLEVTREVKAGKHRAVEVRHAVRTLGANEVGLAGNTGDARLDAWVLKDLLAQDQDVAGGGAHDPTQVRDERGLAAAVWPHKPKDRASRYGEVHPVERRRAVEYLP